MNDRKIKKKPRSRSQNGPEQSLETPDAPKNYRPRGERKKDIENPFVARQEEDVRLPDKAPGQRRRNPGMIPWGDIRREYVEGRVFDEGKKTEKRVWPTQKELSERFNVGEQQIANRSSKERWTELRNQFEIKMTMEYQSRRAKRMAQVANEFDDTAYTVAERGIAMVTIRLGEIAQEIEARQNLRDNSLALLRGGVLPKKEEMYSGINYRELEGLANSAARFQEIGMRALGTNIDRSAVVGPDGQIIDPTKATLDIRTELVRDDADRAAALTAAMIDAGVLDPAIVDAIIDQDQKQIASAPDREDDDSIIDAEIEESTDEQIQHEQDRGAA